ncbi:hypothetical protein C8J56DRAFT_1062337 [Mycena floridula]|nr:hypothetical protein C8J56DRAFT_1062337 [Mycena floridula]
MTALSRHVLLGNTDKKSQGIYEHAIFVRTGSGEPPLPMYICCLSHSLAQRVLQELSPVIASLQSSQDLSQNIDTFQSAVGLQRLNNALVAPGREFFAVILGHRIGVYMNRVEAEATVQRSDPQWRRMLAFPTFAKAFLTMLCHGRDITLDISPPTIVPSPPTFPVLNSPSLPSTAAPVFVREASQGPVNVIYSEHVIINNNSSPMRSSSNGQIRPVGLTHWPQRYLTLHNYTENDCRIVYDAWLSCRDCESFIHSIGAVDMEDNAARFVWELLEMFQ